MKNGRKISLILEDFISNFDKPTATIADLRDAIEGRSYSILMFILALPCIIPIPTPGLSAVLSAPLIIMTFQWMIGLKKPWFPGFISERKFKCEQMKRAIDRISPYLKKLESILKPRFQFLVNFPADRILSIICFALSLMIMLPIPFGNALPAFAICCISIGMLMRDGIMILVGLTVTAGCTMLFSTAIGAVISSVQSLL